jgi:ATP-binding cassette subfamily B protein
MYGLHEDAIKGKAYDTRLLLRLAKWLTPYRWQLGGILLTLPLIAACRLAQPLIIKHAIDNAIVPGQLNLLFAPALLFLLLLLAESLFTWFEVYGLQAIGQKVMACLRNRLFERLLHLPARWFDHTPAGGAVTRLTSDIEALGEMFAAGIITVVADFFLLIGIVIAMLWMTPTLSLVTFTILPPLILAVWLFRHNMRRAYREVRAHLGRLNANLAEVTSNITVVQSFGRETEEKKRFNTLNQAYRDANLPVIGWDASLYAVVEMFSALAIALIIWYGGGQLVQGALTFGTLVAFIQYIEKFFTPIRDLSAKYGVMQGTMAALERIFALLDEKTEAESIIHPAKQNIVAIEPNRAVQTVQPKPFIEFKDVCFAYRQGEPVLQNFNLSVRQGERVALVGKSGSGKTTITRLLERFYEVQSGKILLHGTEIQMLSLAELRSQMTFVPQEPFVFAGTITFNISLGDETAARNVRKAAALTGADRFIERLPHKYETILTERGTNLSLGERQLLSFARAIAFNPQLLVLDEATASVDRKTEELIQTGLKQLLTGRTALVIAHRLSTVRDADKIVVINNGHAVEEGTHAQLLEMGGEYSKLYASSIL